MNAQNLNVTNEVTKVQMTAEQVVIDEQAAAAEHALNELKANVQKYAMLAPNDPARVAIDEQLTPEKVAGYVADIANNNVDEFTFELLKVIFFQNSIKTMCGIAITSDENQINLFVAKGYQKSLGKAQLKAKAEAEAKQAEAKYKADLQKFELETFGIFAQWLKDQSTEVNRLKSDKSNVNTLSIDTLKGKFADLLAVINASPLKPAKVKSTKSSNGTGTYNSESYANPKKADVTKLIEGSINKCLYDTLVAGSYTKSELLKAIQTALPEKTEGAIRVAIEKALNGRFDVIVTNDKLSIVPVTLPDVPMEIVDTTNEAEK